MRKMIYGGLFLALVGIGFVGCKKQEVKELSEVESIEVETETIIEKSLYVFSTTANLYFDEMTGQVYQEDNPRIPASATFHEIELSIQSRGFMPEFNSQQEILEFYENEIDDFYGDIILKIDGNEIYRAEINQGVKVNEFFEYALGDYPCTFDGLSHCTQDTIADYNWFDTALCILEGPGCAFTVFISCAVDNC